MGFIIKKCGHPLPGFNLKKGCIVMIVLMFGFSVSTLRAQESMIPSVSYAYLDKLIDTAKKYYPQMKIYQKRVEIAQVNLQKTKVGWLDVFSVTVNYSPSGGFSSLNQPTLSGFQVGLFVNIAAFLQKPYLVKQARGDAEISKLNEQEYHMLLEADVKARYIKYVQAATVLKVQSKIALEAESIAKESRYKFEKGEVSFEAFTKALIYESDNRKQVIEVEGNFLIAQNSLETIVGKKLADIH